MFWIDYWYLILVLPAIVFSLICSIRVKTTFAKYAKVKSKRGMTASDAARMVLNANGVTGVAIGMVSGDLTDHYDPRTNVINLSEKVYNDTSVAAIGVAAHEAGHAVQHACGYLPIKIREAIIPATKFGSSVSWIMIMIGLIMIGYAENAGSIGYYIAMLGVALFGLTVVFQLVTLPTEFNASQRAIQAIESCGILDGNEIKGSKKVLWAAAMTYFAALVVSLMQLLRLLLIVTGRNNRRR